jgi:hypothetical protein
VENDDDPVVNLSRFTLSLSTRIDDLVARAEATRLILEALGVSRHTYEEVRQAVYEEIRQRHQKGLSDAIERETDERLRKALESLKGPKQ